MTDRSGPIHLIVNPGAGAVESDPECLDRVRSHEVVRGAHVELPESVEETRKAVRTALASGARTVVAGGGDGTIRTVVDELLRSRDERTGARSPRLGILPLGTANDLARSIGVADLEDALQALESAEIRAVDALEVTLDDHTPTWCANICVGGFVGRMQDVVTPEMKSWWGPLAYIRGGVEALGEGAFSAWIEVDGRPRRSIEFLSLAFANGRYSGGGIPLAPDARMDDGRMEVVIVDDLPLTAVATLAPMMLAGRHAGHDAVHIERAQAVEVGSETPFAFSLDGERRDANRLCIRVEPGALPLIMGADPDGTGASDRGP